MKILDDGSVYIEKGESFPFKCPACGKFIPFEAAAVEVICACGFHGDVKEFSEVEYKIATKH